MAMKPCKECKNIVSTSAKSCPHCGKKYPTGGFTLPAKIGLVVVGLIALGQVPSIFSGTAQTGTDPKTEALQSSNIKMQWNTGGFGSVMMADFTITNGSKYPIKDITIKCTHYAPSGTQIDSNTRTIYEVVPANSTKEIKNFSMGFIASQVKSSSAKIVDLEIAK